MGWKPAFLILLASPAHPVGSNSPGARGELER